MVQERFATVLHWSHQTVETKSAGSLHRTFPSFLTRRPLFLGTLTEKAESNPTLHSGHPFVARAGTQLRRPGTRAGPMGVPPSDEQTHHISV